MAESELVLLDANSAENPPFLAEPAAVSNTDSAQGDFERGLRESKNIEAVSSKSAEVIALHRLNSLATAKGGTALYAEAWQHDMIALLSNIKDELTMGKLSKMDPVLSSSLTEKIISVHLPDDVKREEARRLFGVLSQVDSVKATGGKTYNYEEKYPEDAPGEELGADARVFKVYNDEAEKYDADMIRGFKDSLDGLLVFASLFSAVVTTILTQTIQALPTDHPRITNHLLYETTLLLRAHGDVNLINSISRSPYGPDSNTFEATDVWINGLFIASLALSLTTALLSVLAKQWLQAYTTVTSGSARDVALIRHIRFTGFEKWKMDEIIGTLPLILHTSLGIFFAGLFVFIRTLYPALGWIIISISGVTFLVYLGTILLPTFYLECPFRLPAFHRSLEKAERSAVAEDSASRHANPLGSITWLSQLSSNATVKHITAWTVASEKTWAYNGIWDYLNPETIQMLFDVVWTVDRQNTVSARAFSQLVTNAKRYSSYWTPTSDTPVSYTRAAVVHDTWSSKFESDLCRAVEEGRVHYVREILGTSQVIADTMLGEISILQFTVINGDLEMVKLLVTELEADVNLLTTGRDGSALAAAAYFGRLEVVKFLVTEAAADVNLLLPASDYGSALAAAARQGELEVVKFLVTEGGADVNMHLSAGDYGSALAGAAYWGQLQVVTFLVTEGRANVNLLLTAGSYGSALAAAACQGELEVVKFLVIGGGADVNMRLNVGPYGSALTAAVFGGAFSVIQFLVQEGNADVNLQLSKDYPWPTALHAATTGYISCNTLRDYDTIVEFLRDVGARPDK